MRGTLESRRCMDDLPGIIPAYAGNTLNVIRMCLIMWDHPRVCGEHIPVNTARHVKQGSSPRMRGTHADRKPEVYVEGIIPAYAGNTLVR